MMIKKRYKNLKPIDYEISLIYKCPECTFQHWLSISEARTKGFKVVCDCGVVFRVKLVQDINVVYQPEEDKVQIKTIETKTEANKIPEPSRDLVNKCVSILDEYGFSKTESLEMIKKAYKENPSEDVGSIVKLCISNFTFGE